MFLSFLGRSGSSPPKLLPPGNLETSLKLTNFSNVYKADMTDIVSDMIYALNSWRLNSLRETVLSAFHNSTTPQVCIFIMVCFIAWILEIHIDVEHPVMEFCSIFTWSLIKYNFDHRSEFREAVNKATWILKLMLYVTGMKPMLACDVAFVGNSKMLEALMIITISYIITNIMYRR